MAPQLDKMNQVLYSDSWYEQWVKKVVSKSPELVDFALGLVNSVLNLLMGKWSFQGIQITEELKSMINKNFNSLVEMTFREVHASYNIPEWQAVNLTSFAPWWVGKLIKFISLGLPFLIRQENKKQSCVVSREVSTWNLLDVWQNPTCGRTQWPDRSNLQDYHSTINF